MVLAAGWRNVNTDGRVALAMAGRELMGGGIAALAGKDKKLMMSGRCVGADGTV